MKKSLFKKNLSAALILAAQSLFLVAVVMMAIFPAGCKLTEIPGILSGDFETPVITQFLVKDEVSVELHFSEEVIISDSSLPCSQRENDKSVYVFTLPQASVPGKEYFLTGQVEDKNGNSLTFSIPFIGYNGNVPKLIMTEVQTESVSSRNSFEKSQDFYKTEFVEFLVLSRGNLSGLELVSVHDGEDKKFIFPSIEVTAGEIIVVHLRKRGSGCISETGSDLNQAFSSYTTDGVRDLWSESESTALGNKTDVVFLRNSADGSVLDAVMYVDKNFTEWKESFLPYVQMVVESGIYDAGNLDYVTNAGEKTNSKTLSRKGAGELMNLVLEGNDVDYPVKVSTDSWIVSTASSGKIGE